MSAENKLQLSLYNLLRVNNTFYAALIQQMRIIQDTELKAGYAGVAIQNGRILFVWNPDMWEKLSLEECIGIIIHECEHLVRFHLDRMGPRRAIAVTGDGQPVTVWNIATDISINPSIPKLPPGVLQPQQFGLPLEKISEWYYNELMHKIPQHSCPVHGSKGKGGQGQKDQQGQPCSGQGDSQGGDQKQDQKGGGGSNQQKDQQQKAGGGKDQPDPKCTCGQAVGDHSKWGDIKDAELAHEVTKNAIQNAVDRSPGKIPNHLEEFIKAWLTPPTIPWDRILHKYIGMHVRSGFKTTWKRPNRRYGEYQKGQTRNRKLQIIVAIDTSSSISTDDLKKFQSEIHGIMKSYQAKVKVIECDAEVQKVYELSLHDKFGTKFGVHGRGGTDFRPVFKHVHDNKMVCDLLIYLTDLQGPFPTHPPLYPVIWVSVEDGKVPFGLKLVIPKKGKHSNEEE